uniref:RNA-dependent RNA polymerase n=1 Tax=Ditylenchus dipsaci TaxID=166011 RepID=A0A915CZD6_9BILA
MRQLHEVHQKEGYVRVRKVVITPTRLLYVAPELLMGNRVLRSDPEKYPLEKFLRVVFRDDDGSPVHANSVGDALIQRFIGGKLRNGVLVAGRTFNYFGSSNSQLRDNGCYFINATVKEIEDFRTQLGSFKMQSAPKMMSRLGQCFTQARETGIQLDRRLYADDFDLQGGKDSAGEPYTFSDGVGRMSMKTAKELGKELGLDGCTPSCFQFRFRGYKGVLAVDTSLDSMREWGLRNGVQDITDIRKRDCWLDLAIKFRPSQKKFEAKRDGSKLEIVKYSSPVSISLNRPVINILDQVSGLQSHSSHRRICDRIHYLMDMHLHSLTRSLMDEQKARNKLGEFPKLIIYEQITDLNLTKEPFFRGMVRASVRASLRKLRQKLQIPIPNSLGRAMFGVVDESGLLQHGQVFIRYTKNAFLKLPGPTADRVVLKGPVLLTKIHRLWLVIFGCLMLLICLVFTISATFVCFTITCFSVFGHGPRPHTDEMAGSDLDGDEYTIIWDEQLYLDHNEEAFDYTSKSHESVATSEEELRLKMADFFVDYIKQDSIGRIANAFLINSDLFGIKSNVCMKIAEKHMEAVDFPKTGVPPKPLETNSRLNGQLFRRAKEIDDILSLATQDDETAAVPLDLLISFPGYDDPEILQLASEHYEAYAANINSIMDSYGIKTEGELFSGHYSSLRNRISDKDNDDMSFYNTSNAIEQRLFAVFGKFRKSFFETSFNGRQQQFEDVTAFGQNSARGGHKEVFRRVCTDPSEDFQRLACAYYKTAYDSKTRKLLSFPWLAWDVINVVRRTNACNSTLLEAKFSFDPLSEKVSKHIEEYIAHRSKAFNQFLSRMHHPSKALEDERVAWRTLAMYCQHHKGLDQLLFFCSKWAKTKTVPYWLEMVNSDNPNIGKDVIDLEQQHGGLGKKFMIFLQFLASRQFEMLPFINFMEPSLGYASAFYQKQWWPIHKAALNAFHQIAFTFRFDALPATSDQRKNFLDYAPIRSIKEAEPFIIEVPSSHHQQVINNKELLNRLCQRSGCTQIVFRPLPQFQGYDTVRLFVSVTGTVDAINELRSILSVRPNLNLSNNCRQMSMLMAAAIYEKLTS